MIVAFLALAACSAPPEETPPDMQELTWMLLRDFGTDAQIQEAEYLAAWIDEEIAEPEAGYALEIPANSYIDELELSENLDLAGMSGAMVIKRVRGTIDQHAAVVPEVDQSFADSSYDRWDRTITNGAEDDWLAGSRLVADDDIELDAGFGVILPYPMLRDYMWVELERGACVLTRSAIYEEGWADDNNGILGGFTIEAWLPDGDGMIWMNATWTQVISLVGDNEEFYTNQIILGSTEVMEGTELYVAGEE